MTAEAAAGPNIRITLPTLHPTQRNIARSPARFKVVNCGRRWGKTALGIVLCLAGNEADPRQRGALRGGRIWWIGPTYKQAQEGWTYLLALVRQMPATMVTVSHTELKVSFAGGGSVQVRTEGGDPDNLRGAGLDGVVCDEYALFNPDSWSQVLRPALADKQGWAMFISSPQHFNHFWSLYEMAEAGADDWACWTHPTWDNPYIAASEIEAARRDMLDEDFEQEFGASFTAVGGAVFRLLSSDRPIYLRTMPAGLDVRRTGVGMDWGCLPLDTAILTRDGWKTHDELEIGEEVASVRGHATTYRATRSEVEVVWTPLLNKVYRPNEPLVRMGDGHTGFHFTCTPDHAWLSRHQRTGVVRRFALHETAKTRYLVVAAECHEEGLIDCTPAEAAVLGWLVTDGWIQGSWQEHKFAATIAQKTKVSELLRDLDESGLPYHQVKPNRQGVGLWRLASPSARSWLLRMGYRGKEMLPELVTRLGPPQRDRMLQAMVLAEGSLVRRDFNQTEGPVLEAFEILATLAGYKLTGGHSVPSGWSDKIRRRYRLSKKREQIKPQVVEAGRGDTWCPTVAYGSVIAKQGQQITITGNTTPQHEAAVVSGSLMSTGAVWVRSAWLDHSGSSDLWRAEAVRCSRDYGATFARVDRSQSSELDRIKSAGFWDAASGNAHVEVRLAEFQSLVMKRAIFFDLAGPGVQAYYDHLCAYHRDREGKIVEEQDDDVDAGCYLVSELVRPTAEFAPPVARPVYKTDPRPVPYRGANVRNKVRGGAA